MLPAAGRYLFSSDVGQNCLQKTPLAMQAQLPIGILVGRASVLHPTFQQRAEKGTCRAPFHIDPGSNFPAIPMRGGECENTLSYETATLVHS